MSAADTPSPDVLGALRAALGTQYTIDVDGVAAKQVVEARQELASLRDAGR